MSAQAPPMAGPPTPEQLAQLEHFREVVGSYIAQDRLHRGAYG